MVKLIRRGFTLIELVVVIILLGILAAVALPRFLDLSSQARTSAQQGMVAGLATAVSIMYAKAHIQSTTVSTESPAAAGGTVITTAIAVDLDPGLPTGLSQYLWFNTSYYPVGGHPKASRVSGNVTVDEAHLIWGASGHDFAMNCNSIFNLLLSGSSTQAGDDGYWVSNADPGLAAVKADATYTYTTVLLDTIVNNVNGGTDEYEPLATAGTNAYDRHGLCIWQRTETTSLPTKMYIAYDPFSGQFVNLTSVENPS